MFKNSNFATEAPPSPATKPDECCPYCDDSWVEALNPDVTVKKGQKIVLTCAVHAEVPKSAIVWYKGNHKVKKGISRNRCVVDGTSLIMGQTEDRSKIL